MNNNVYIVLIAILSYAVFMGISLKICDKEGEEEDNENRINKRSD